MRDSGPRAVGRAWEPRAGFPRTFQSGPTRGNRAWVEIMLLHEQVRRAIRRHGLLHAGDRVIVALSGGPDSVALLRVMHDIACEEQFHLAGAAHLNHQLRGVESDRDEAFCRGLAAEVSVPIDVERSDIAGLARQTGLSLEHAAHDARLAFFERAAARMEACRVAVGHTRDDQAETFLLRLLRGAGPRGLGGMYPRSGLVIRPLLETSRQDVGDFLHQTQVEYREDASNADRAIPRNRIRHELIPFLESRFAPNVVDVLNREAAIARDDAQYLEEASAAAVRELVVRTPDRIEISIRQLLAQPPAIARRVVRAAQQLAAGGKFVGFDAADAVLMLAVSNLAGPLDLPGHRVNRVGQTLVLTHSAGRLPRRGPDEATKFSYELEVPGEVRVPEAACAITAKAESVPPGQSAGTCWPLANRGNQVVIEGGRLAGPLVVRNRRPGDIFRPLGLQGRKKLQDFFVDAKVRRTERDTVPLVVDSRGQIVWVAGLSVAEEFRVTDRTRAVVILKRQPI
jgi:tRNA(Ile)-lysidine synthase